MGNSDDDRAKSFDPRQGLGDRVRRQTQPDVNAQDAVTRPSIEMASLSPRRARELTEESLRKMTAATTPDMGGPVDPYDENLTGMRIGENYEIVEKVGEGGMSAVYRGVQVHLNREVAVKMLHPHLIANRISRERFGQEARAVSQIEHPNVVRLLDFGITEENRPYIVMDFLRGNALSQGIKVRGPFDIEDALPIFMQICDALAYTHRLGIVHRDLKPSNIILLDRAKAAPRSRRPIGRGGAEDDTESGIRYTAKIVDFGIAKLSPHEDSGVAALTQTGDVFGSPLYMSPEQARGEKLDSRADIYSMGCLMYETLTGVPPINGSNMLEILYRHMNEMPQPMSVVAKDKEIPRNLEAIVFKALAKDPKDRYQDMESLAADLNAFSDAPAGFIESITSFWSLYRSRRRKLNVREKVATGAIIATAFSFLLGAGAFAMFYVKGTQDFSNEDITWLKALHKSRLENMYGQRAQLVNYTNRAAEARVRELKQMVAKGQAVVPSAEDYEMIQSLSQKAVDLRAKDDLNKAEEITDVLIDFCSIVHGYGSVITRQVMILKLMTLYDAQKYREAITLINQMRRDVPEPILYAKAHFKALMYSISGECHFNLKEYEAARSELLEALTNWQAADREKDSYDLALSEIKALSTSYFADTFAIDGMWEEANKYYQKAEPLWKAAPPPRNDYNQAVAFFKESLAFSHLKKEAEAERSFARAISLLHKHPKDFLFFQTEVQMMQISAKMEQEEGHWLTATQRYIQAGLIKNRSGPSNGDKAI